MQKVSPSCNTRGIVVGITNLDKIPGIISYPIVQVKEVRVLPGVSLGIRNELANVLADEGSLGNVGECANAPAHSPRAENLESHRDPVLDHAVVAHGHVALAHGVALDDVRRLFVVEALLEAALRIVPRLYAEVGAVTGVLGGAGVGAFAVLQEVTV